MIDDEADLAGVRFVQKRGDPAVSQVTIAEQIDDLRRLAHDVAFFQVTATPYSLYLQPEGYEAAITGGNYVFKPKKPAFTELLPIHGGYVGGNDYFGDFDDDDPRAHLFVDVSDQEQDALRRQDHRRISPDRVLDSPNTVGLRRAIVAFVLAVCVRRWQQDEAGEKKKKYSMIIHNDTQRSAHAWQDQVIDWIFDAILRAGENAPATLRPLFDQAYDDLNVSVFADRGRMPDRDAAFTMFIDALRSDDVVRERVNSDQNVLALLDNKGELRLRTPYNIFVGGNILDRGITIPNLIAFYYGRNPRTMQADTVLQHSRMYGNRDRRDLAVTRLYTSQGVYDRLYTINDFENTLRQAFESGAHDQGVVFLQTDAARRVRPCAPNKVRLSDVVSVRPRGLLLPTSFDTVGGSEMNAIQSKLERLIAPAWRTGAFVTINCDQALEIISTIEEGFTFTGVEFEWDAMRSLIDYYSDAERGGDGTLLLLAETGRHLDRERSGDKSGLSILGTALRPIVVDAARSKPALVLLQQEGSRELGWRGNKRFWWPTLALPSDVEPCVFAGKVAA